MTEVAFHFNAPDKLGYACRLLRKAAGGGARVAVAAPPELLQSLDAQLWTFSELDFVPHCAVGRVPDAVLRRSPVVLTPTPAQAPHRQVLLNLGDEVPAAFEGFERLIEVVTGDAADRQQARQRWKHYADRGYAIVKHDLQEAR